MLRRVGEHLLLAQRSRRFGDEKIEPRDEALELGSRLTDRLADFLRQRLRERVAARLDELAKFLDRRNPLADRRRGPARLRRARGGITLRDFARPVRGEPQDD